MADLAAMIPVVGAAFAGAFVEVVEAFTVVLAVGIVSGWRPALLGTGAALGVLALMVLALGPLLAFVPIHTLQLFVGVLLLLFGLRWLRKAILRAVGVIPLHDEEAAFKSETAELSAPQMKAAKNRAWLAGLAAFKAVLLEGVEVVFIVLAVGSSGNMLWPAAAGALLATLIVLLIGLLVHKPLSTVPENTLKFSVGVMLAAFGLFWTGEGLGISWPGADWSIVSFAAMFLGLGLLLIAGLKSNQVASAR